jgi:F0F1-type ATP synthase assembly protein I
MSNPDDQNKDRLQHAYNLTLASVTGLVGCLTMVIVIAALVLGLWLDKSFDTKPLFTLILIIGSVPVTLVVMFMVVNSATKRIKVDQPKKKVDISEEVQNRD